MCELDDVFVVHQNACDLEERLLCISAGIEPALPRWSSTGWGVTYQLFFLFSDLRKQLLKHPRYEATVLQYKMSQSAQKHQPLKATTKMHLDCIKMLTSSLAMVMKRSLRR